MGIRRHIAITFVSKYVEMGLGLVASIVLARLLTPEDFGIYSIAASIVLIGYLFRNFGVGQMIVQADELTDDLLRAAFAVTLTISWGIGLLLVLIAPWVGGFYANPGVTQVLYFLALNFVLLPFGAVSDAVLRRRMAFDKLAVISISSALASVVVGITSAWLGARYLAIAWSGNASTLTTILLTLFYRPKGLPWKPGLRGMREVFRFGMKVGTMDMVNKGSDSLSEVLIGKAHGLHQLGIYSRAYGAFMLFEYAFIEGIRPVVLPYLSEARRGEGDLSKIYLRIVNYAAIFMLPFFSYLAIAAPEVMRTLYGSQWDASVPLLQLMCGAGALLSVTIFFDQLLIARGCPGEALFYQSMAQAARVAALLFLLSGSLLAVAAAVIVGAAVKAALVIRMARKHLALDAAQFVREAAPAMVVAAVVAGAVALSSQWLAGVSSELLRFVGLSLAALVSWLMALFALRHPLTVELRRWMPAGRS